MPFRKLLTTSKLPVPFLLCCLLNVVLLEPVRANEQTDELAEISAERQEEILAWKKMIDEHRDSVFKVKFVDGDKYKGKLVLTEGGVLVRRKKFQNLTEGEILIDHVDWQRIRSVNYYSKEDREDRIGKGILIGILSVTVVGVLWFFATIGNT